MGRRDVTIWINGKETVTPAAASAGNALTRLGGTLGGLRKVMLGGLGLFGFVQIAGKIRGLLGSLDEIGDRLGGTLGAQAHAASESMARLHKETRGFTDEAMGRLAPHIAAASNAMTELTKDSGARQAFGDWLETQANRASVIAEKLGRVAGFPGGEKITGPQLEKWLGKTMPTFGSAQAILGAFGGSGEQGSAAVEREKANAAARAAGSFREFVNKQFDAIDKAVNKNKGKETGDAVAGLLKGSASGIGGVMGRVMGFAGQGGKQLDELNKKMKGMADTANVLAGIFEDATTPLEAFNRRMFDLKSAEPFMGAEKSDWMQHLARRKFEDESGVTRNLTPLEKFRKDLEHAQVELGVGRITKETFGLDRIRLVKDLMGTLPGQAPGLAATEAGALARGRGAKIDPAAQANANAKKLIEVNKRQEEFAKLQLRALEKVEKLLASAGGVFP